MLEWLRCGQCWVLYVSFVFVLTWSKVVLPLVGMETCWWNFCRAFLRLRWLKSPITMKRLSECLFCSELIASLSSSSVFLATGLWDIYSCYINCAEFSQQIEWPSLNHQVFSCCLAVTADDYGVWTPVLIVVCTWPSTSLLTRRLCSVCLIAR